MPAASNALVGSVFFVAVLVSDALTAVETTAHADVPASMRGTGVVLACCFAAPVILRPERGIFGVWQRPLLGALLLAAALLGEHHGGARIRAFDGIYTTIVGLVVTWLFSAGGVDEMSRESEKGNKMNNAVSTSSVMLASALMFYSNARIVRAGLRHASEVQAFRVRPTGEHNASAAVETLGYAYASSTATISVSGGGAAGVAAAISMMRHAHDFSHGTHAVALQLGVAAVLQMLCALAALLSYGEQVDRLPAIFGASGCVSASDACDVATMSRRFASANTQAPGLWLSALGLFALAYPVKTRFLTQSEARRHVWTVLGSLTGLAAVVVALALIYMSADFAGVGGHTDYVAMVVVFGIFWSFYWDTLVGTVVTVAAYAVEEVLYAADYGSDTLFSHLTHLALVVTIALLALHLALQTVLYWYAPRRLQEFTGAVAVAGTSIALALYTASCCLLLANNGRVGNLIDANDGASFALTFTLQHFLPLFAWAPLYSCRCELQLLSSTQRLVSWLSAAPLVGATYLLTLLGLNASPPTAAVLDGVSLTGCVIGVGVAPWMAASSV